MTALVYRCNSLNRTPLKIAQQYNVIYTSLKSTFSAQQFPRWQCGSLIRWPRFLRSLWNFTVKLSIRKLESWGYSAVKVALP